ncbi:MAG: hypothetical protein R3E10_02150 [Gemmatimonadota bacterium]
MLPAALLGFRPLAAQQEASAELRGTVMRAGTPMSDAEVVLHRVSPDSAGELARTSSESDGGFHFLFPYVPDPDRLDEVFFASVRHDGILYFGPTLTSPADLDSLYIIEVYDTVTAPVGGAPLVVAVRNLVLEPLDEGWQATDLIEVRNEDTRTWVAGPLGDAVWSVAFPSGSTDHQVGESDLPPAGAVFDGDVARTTAAVPPGPRLFLFRYRIPSVGFTLPLVGVTERMEVLVREPAPALSVWGLEGGPPAELEPGTTFRRYVGEDLVDSAVRIDPGGPDRRLPLAPLMVVLGLSLGVLGLWGYSRGRAPRDGRDRSEIVAEIARLDEEFERQAPANGVQRARYERTRAELLRALHRAGADQ